MENESESTASVAAAAKAADDAKNALIAEYRSQLLEARGLAAMAVRKLGEAQALSRTLAGELEEARRELARRDDRIRELEQQAELAGWREKLGAL